MYPDNISCFENSVDPDQLASEKQADQDPYIFPLYLLVLMLYVPVSNFSFMLGRVFLD